MVFLCPSVVARERRAGTARRGARGRTRALFLNCERIASPASRRPLRGGLRPVLTDSLLTPPTRSADGPVKRWLRHLRPPLAGLLWVGRGGRTPPGRQPNQNFAPG